MAHFYKRGGRGGYYNHSRNQSGGPQNHHHSSVAASKPKKVYKIAKQAANQLNQYYLEAFTKLKKDCDLRQISNLSLSYKRIISALSKYPLPILCGEQTLQLEGVGNVLATRFNDMIQARKKEYEDGVFQIELLKQQKKSISKDYRSFAGILIPESDIDLVGEMSLVEYLVKRDGQIFRINNGIEEADDLGQPDKKRKFSEISSAQAISGNDIQRKKLGMVDASAFLDVGSVSWSMLIAIFFLALHDDRKTYYITLSSIKEMLEVLKAEFSDFMPFESDKRMLDQFSFADLQKFRENQFIDILESTIPKDPSEWKFTMTEKGKNRAKNLCKAVGLQIQIENDLDNPNKHKITVNMYDKDLMPVVDNFYMLDGTQMHQMKQEGGSGPEKHQIFDQYTHQIENEMDLLLFNLGGSGQYNATKEQRFSGSKQYSQSTSGQSNLKKEGDQLNQSIFAQLMDLGNQEDEDEEDQDCEDDIMMDDHPFEKQTQQNQDSLLSTDLMKMMISDESNQNSNTIAYQLKKNHSNLTQGQSQTFTQLNSFSFSKKTEQPYQQIFDSKGALKNQQSIIRKLNQQEFEMSSEVVLFVDNREKKNQRDGNYLFERLQSTGVNCELKTLPLGDFIWVLRVRNPNFAVIDDEEYIEDEGLVQDNKKTKKGAASKKNKKKPVSQKEYVDYVLDFICERKTADDLAASILDGRYDEQKFRLKNSEINNVIYLVEGKPSQFCKIPLQVLNKAQIHTQIFHGFNVLRVSTIQESLKWLTDMTREIKSQIAAIKQSQKNFENNIKDKLIDFKHFQNESGKNSNLDVQHIFSRQLRTIKGLGTDHVSTISRVFKTPYFLYKSFMHCISDEKKCHNLLNAGKMELMRSEYMYRQALTNSDQVITVDEKGPSIPKKIDDSDVIDLQKVIQAADPKFYNKVLKQFETNYGVKMRKINKNQSESIFNVFCSQSYKYRKNSGIYGYGGANSGRKGKRDAQINYAEEDEGEPME